MPLRIAVIVEGHGEDGAIRPLLERIWYEFLKGDQLDVLRPFRRPQGMLLQEAGLKTTVDAAMIELTRQPPDGFQRLVLILIDSEGKCPENLAPQLLTWGREARTDADIACVMPHPMFETWFVAAASSLAGERGFPADLIAPDDPEGNKLGKGWIKKKLPRKYSETADQPRFAAKIDLTLCRQNSPSFDKLCRELENRLPIKDSSQPVGNDSPKP
jgi:Domain of unknown function (DUF4276)